MRGPLGLNQLYRCFLGGFPLLLGLLGLCGLGQIRTGSCTCVPGPPLTSTRVVQEIAAMYDAVLEGVLVKVDWVRAPRPVPKGEFPIDDAVATVAVARHWQGMGPDTVVVRTALFTEACGLPFQQGDRYLLFARKVQGGLYASKCGPSRLWDEEAERLVQLLGPGHPVQ
jgi:hypothetical protein